MGVCTHKSRPGIAAWPLALTSINWTHPSRISRARRKLSSARWPAMQLSASTIIWSISTSILLLRIDIKELISELSIVSNRSFKMATTGKSPRGFVSFHPSLHDFLVSCRAFVSCRYGVMSGFRSSSGKCLKVPTIMPMSPYSATLSLCVRFGGSIRSSSEGFSGECETFSWRLF